ncbi:DUF3626 domain-containing protein [Sediminitomix flava]|uniref:Uncharacterized protein DUF3626 n=1 Tax=Sediminitomix flava TaxID=379075 RepID=A0A315Z515_SEDFL|nr:DUF3626 domain-containing protein [Sediminitomix flava]PWJ37973.1 uncharacterized protein DUF3626 [Sediminitomix flava]
MLTVSQQKAIENVSRFAFVNKQKYQDQIDMILYQSNIDKEVYSEFCSNIFKNSCINLHFHPDRLITENLSVAKSLNQTGIYKNQYETKISSGSVTAFDGGFREEWEENIFSDAYKNTPPKERPKYGALNLTLTKDGASPRFGSCYFILKPEVKNRTTFSYGDTYLAPKEIGTIENFELITAALFYELFTRGTALGDINTDVLNFMNQVNENIPYSSNFDKYKKNSKNLDFYIETQVHGDISLSKDVIGLVVDQSFFKTEIGQELEDLCDRYKIQLNWNAGLELKVEDFPNNFRGAEVPNYAAKYAKDGVMNAYLIGQVAHKMGKSHEELQMLKYLWHCLVRFGSEKN